LCEKEKVKVTNAQCITSSVAAILRRLVDIVSRNGNLLLNIGPKADGTLPDAQENVLLEIGKWMKVNREGVFGTQPWKVYGFGEINRTKSFEEGAVRFTQKNGNVYAYFMTWPANGKLMISGITDKMTVKKVSLLGSNKKLEWNAESKGLQVKLPGNKPCEYLWCLRING